MEHYNPQAYTHPPTHTHTHIYSILTCWTVDWRWMMGSTFELKSPAILVWQVFVSSYVLVDDRHKHNEHHHDP